MLLRPISIPRSHYRFIIKPYNPHYQCRHFGDQSRPFPSPYPNRPILEDDNNNNNNKDPNNLALDTSPILTDHIDSMTSNNNDTNNQKGDRIQTDHLKPQPNEDTNSTLSAYRLHHFDTYRLLQSLEQQGFTRPQAEVVMKGIKFKLRESTAQLRKQLLLRSDLENESYLFKAELSELRTEIQIMRRNDTQMLQTDAGIVTREVEVLAQRLREDVATMKNDVTLDMNNRKNETQEEQKAIDMKIQEINNKFTVQMGEVRTELEAVRWETIWKGMAGIAAAGLGIATLGYLLTRFADRQAEVALAEKLKRKKLLKEEARQSGTADMEVIY
ncbi:hypothetical protein BC941DRAFT_408965 [Chlamydoabsidia padenii]|nr:hypothetical protein BC941DRAFT_408965 [Chlamydoabsidia padenii]